MADLSDVQNALVSMLAQIAYPNGTGQPSATSIPTKIYPGWPDPGTLDADLAQGYCHISVFTRPEERNTTRFSKDWQQQSINTPTLTLTISGQTVTIAGATPLSINPHNAEVSANGHTFVYAVQNSDTLTSIATALATLIAAVIPGTSNSGPVITFPSSARISAARVGVNGTLIREVRRQERVFQISIWTNTPPNRDAIAQLIDPVLAATEFITLPDQTAGRLIYKSSPVMDGVQKANLYRRDLLYTVEYATTQTTSATQVTQDQINYTAQDSNSAQISIVQVNL